MAIGTRLLAFALSVVVAPAAASQPNARARQAYDRAVELETRGNYPAALALLWEAAGLAPEDADIQNRLGEGLERLGALDAAIESYKKAIEARPDFRKATNNLILVLGKAGRGAEGVERARALVAEAPDDPDRLYTLGLAQSEQDVNEAIVSFRRVLQLAPRHALARYNLALVLRRVDRLPEALDELQRALEIAPRPEIYYSMGVISLHQGDLDRAAAALRNAIAADSRHTEAYYTLGSVLKARRDYKGASQALRKAIALQPSDAAAHNALAQVLQLAGDEAGARTHEAEAERLRQLTQVEREATLLTSVGIARLDRGDAAGARDAFARAVQAFDSYAPAHYQLGRALLRLGQTGAARAAFARAQQLNPSLVPPPDRQDD